MVAFAIVITMLSILAAAIEQSDIGYNYEPILHNDTLLRGYEDSFNTVASNEIGVGELFSHRNPISLVGKIPVDFGGGVRPYLEFEIEYCADYGDITLISHAVNTIEVDYDIFGIYCVSLPLPDGGELETVRNVERIVRAISEFNSQHIMYIIDPAEQSRHDFRATTFINSGVIITIARYVRFNEESDRENRVDYARASFFIEESGDLLIETLSGGTSIERIAKDGAILRQSRTGLGAYSGAILSYIRISFAELEVGVSGTSAFEFVSGVTIYQSFDVSFCKKGERDMQITEFPEERLMVYMASQHELIITNGSLLEGREYRTITKLANGVRADFARAFRNDEYSGNVDLRFAHISFFMEYHGEIIIETGRTFPDSDMKKVTSFIHLSFNPVL